MKKFVVVLMALAAALLSVGPAMAIDMEALDKVAVMMTKTEVKGLLGEPDQNSKMILGLTAEVYEVSGLEPMVGVGCIYEAEKLVGQAFIFEGSSTDTALENLKSHGFIHYTSRDGVARLLGEDDDTGQPIVVIVVDEGGLTTIITFDKAFYENTLKKEKAE